MKESNYDIMLSLRDFPVAKADTMKLRQEIDRRVRKVFELCASESEIVREAAAKALEEYTQSQRDMFKMKGLNPDRAFKEAMVACEADDGSVIYRIVPRNAKIDISEVDSNGSIHGTSIASAKPYSDRIGLNRDQTRGKYNDGGMLIEASAASVDPSEVVTFSQM